MAKSDEFIEGVLNYQYTRLYLIKDVPIETVFVPRTRKEIKCCEWFSIEHLPTHKTDPVSRNHLGINANSFFMIMPFVKRLKKWINEQALGNQMGKKSKVSETKHMTTAGLININAATIALHERNDAKSPNTVFFKNNATIAGAAAASASTAANTAGTRRQRHKSMGDFDSTNVVAHDSTGDTQQSKQLNSNTKNDTEMKNGYVDSNGVAKSIGGKRKLFTIDQQTSTKRSSSPYASNFQLQPVSSINLNGYCNGNGKYITPNILMKTDTNRKKKSVKPQRSGNEQNGDAEQKWLFNPPKLSQLLSKEPNIANWSNVRLNKDVIMHESLKFPGK